MLLTFVLCSGSQLRVTGETRNFCAIFNTVKRWKAHGRQNSVASAMTMSMNSSKYCVFVRLMKAHSNGIIFNFKLHGGTDTIFFSRFNYAIRRAASSFYKTTKQTNHNLGARREPRHETMEREETTAFIRPRLTQCHASEVSHTVNRVACSYTAIRNRFVKCLAACKHECYTAGWRMFYNVFFPFCLSLFAAAFFFVFAVFVRN